MTNSYVETQINLFRNVMLNKNYAIETVKTYSSAVQTFLNSFETKESVEEITIEEIKNYLETFVNTNTQLSYYSPLKVFYTMVLLDDKTFKIINRPQRKPIVKLYLEKNEMIEKLSLIKNYKHKAILSLTFSIGLKSSELLNVRLKDIKRKKKVLFIRNTSEEIVRVSPISKIMLRLIDKYIKLYQPKKYLFNGQTKPKYSNKSCEQIVKKYLGDAYSMSSLRNSTAVALLNKNINENLIQKQLGLKSKKETKRYFKGLTEKKIKLPI